MSDTDEPERKLQLEEFHFQRRILFGCTIGLFIANFLWIIAMSTNRWFIVSGDGGKLIFVESHRRYFKSSHTGIWRNCRYAIVPHVISSTTVVRNFTTLGYNQNDLKKEREKIAKEEFFLNFPTVDYPDLSTIENITEELRQHMYAEWLKNDHKKFNELKAKFHELYNEDDTYVGKSNTLNPSNINEVKNAIGPLMDSVQINNTATMHLVVPNKLRIALFEGWKDMNFAFVRLLTHYAKAMQINPAIVYQNKLYIFQPPLPPKNIKKPSNGFLYTKWHICINYNLFADEAELAADPAVDEDLLDYIRTAATFSIITIFVMVLGFFFTVYTFLNPRYMFKRLAGGVHFISGTTSALVCRILHIAILHAKENLSYAFPTEAEYSKGFSFYFGCVVAAVNFLSCIMFFWYSRKRKGDKAASEELGMADEAIEIGR